MRSLAVVVLLATSWSLASGQEHDRVWVTSGYNQCTTAFLNATYTDVDGVLETWNRELGKYGECREQDVFGVLVHVDKGGDHTGCSLPLVDKVPTVAWIALVKRGDCNFEVKVLNAFNSNASGVIVYDNKVSYNLQKMKLSSLTRNMSAVFTYKSTGEELAALLDSGIEVQMGIMVGNPCDRQYNLNRTSVLFVSISFIVLMVISLAWLIFYYVQRFRYIHSKDQLSKQLGSAAKKALSKIPTKLVKSGDQEVCGEGECCAVCIELFKVGDTLRVLPCTHEFHKTCIDPWLLERRTCPMCKMDILKHYGFVFTGSQESILHMDVEPTSPSREPTSADASPVPQSRVPTSAPDASPVPQSSEPSGATASSIETETPDSPRT